MSITSLHIGVTLLMIGISIVFFIVYRALGAYESKVDLLEAEIDELELELEIANYWAEYWSKAYYDFFGGTVSNKEQKGDINGQEDQADKA